MMMWQTAWRVAVLAAAMLGAYPVLLQAQSAPVEGVLTAVWGDPEPGSGRSARLHWMLRDDSGAEYEVRLPSDLVERLGGVHAIDRRRVSTRGTLRIRGGAEAGSPVLEATSLQATGSPAAGSESAGTPYAVLLCKFSDEPAEPRPPADFATLMGAGYPNMEHYYAEISNGQFSFAGTAIHGWFTLPQPRSYYVDTAVSTMLSRIANDCTAAADAAVDFSGFSGIIVQLNGNLATSGSGSAWGGSRFMSLDGVSRVWPMAWMPLWATQHGRFGVYAHEIGHSLGLAHSSGPYSEVYDSGWDVMSNSYLRWDSNHGAWIPGQTIAVHKQRLGWIPSDRLVQVTGPLPQTVALDQHSSFAGTGALHVTVPIPGTTAYYSIEGRHLTGYDASLPGQAVIIHRVPTGAACTLNQCARVVDPDNNGNPNDAGAMWIPGETFDDGQGIRVAVTAATATGWNITVTPGNLLTLAAAGSGSGTVTGGSPAVNCVMAGGVTTGVCLAAYYGTPNVTLTATPAAGHTFGGWSGACAGTGTCAVAMSEARSVTATFAPPGAAQHTVTLSASPAAGGTTSGGGTYAAGASVTVLATPANGYVFVNWTENGTPISTSPSFSFSATASRVLVAHFTEVIPDYVISVQGAGSGSGVITSSPAGISCTVSAGAVSGACNTAYAAGTAVTLTAAAAPGHVFTGWSGACSGTAACAVSMTQARSVTAGFAQQFTVTTASSPVAGGTTSGGGTFTTGSAVTVLATPANGYVFVNWTENGAPVSTSPSFSFSVAGHRTLLANFMQQHALTVHAAGGGTGGVTSSPAGISCTVSAGAVSGACNAAYAAGTAVTLTAAAAPGHVFTGWSGACSGTAACAVSMTQARSVTAGFAEQFTVTTTSSPVAGGTTSGGGTFTAGSAVDVLATPANGYDFLEWVEAGTAVSSQASYGFVLTRHRSLTANFVRRRHAVTAMGSGSGSGLITSAPEGLSCSVTAGVTSGSCSATFEQDVQVTLTITPANGSAFTRWTGCTAAASSCVVAATQAHTVSAELLARPAGLTVTRAGDALVGKAVLSTAELEYLDTIGNRNGRFDTGDFLALRDQR
jgi:M6 family metalloprotease-like protein